jgi:hypothetical protein
MVVNKVCGMCNNKYCPVYQAGQYNKAKQCQGCKHNITNNDILDKSDLPDFFKDIFRDKK